MTDDIIDRLPAPTRWAAYVLLALSITGIAPILAAAALIALCDALGGWLVLVALAGAVVIVWRAI